MNNCFVCTFAEHVAPASMRMIWCKHIISLHQTRWLGISGTTGFMHNDNVNGCTIVSTEWSVSNKKAHKRRFVNEKQSDEETITECHSSQIAASNHCSLLLLQWHNVLCQSTVKSRDQTGNINRESIDLMSHEAFKLISLAWIFLDFCVHKNWNWKIPLCYTSMSVIKIAILPMRYHKMWLFA